MTPVFERPVLYLREAVPGDASPLLEAARSARFRSLNFPDTVEGVRAKIERSQGSFRRITFNPGDQEYMFTVLSGIGSDAIPIGCSTLFRKHGTPDRPHTAWRKIRNTGVDRSGQVVDDSLLVLVLDHDGPAEVGAMVVHNSYQGHGFGRAGSWIRFFWAAQPDEREGFRNSQCLSEFLPPLDEARQEGNAFYQALARHFFGGRPYGEMDIATLADRHQITHHFRRLVKVSQLPQEAREVIGAIGEGSRRAAALLEELGFRDSGCVDPLDGGPHFVGAFSENPIFTGAREVHFSGTAEGSAGETGWEYGFIALSRPRGDLMFEACAAPYRVVSGNLRTKSEVIEALRLNGGDAVTVFAYP